MLIACALAPQRVRIAALRYLGTLPSVVRYDVLHPQKATVIRELGKALDDPKRAVRSEAVEARYARRLLLAYRILITAQDELVQIHRLGVDTLETKGRVYV